MEICLDAKRSTERSVVALGMFDGVHLGHRVLLKKAHVLAQRLDAPMVVQTFAEHPLRLIRPEAVPPMLTTLDERVKLIEQQGANIFCGEHFSTEMRDTPPADFIGQLVRRWHPAAVVVGFNHTFGRKGEGTPAMLAAVGQALGFETYVVPEIDYDGEAVSSTRIRKLLTEGQAAEAAKLLARPYTRQAELVAREGGVCRLVCTPNGKQDLAQGRYRALLDDGARRFPVNVRVLDDGKLRCSLPESVELRSELTFHFLSEIT